MIYWLPLEAKTTSILSLCHSDNERHQSVTNFWSCNLGNLCVILLEKLIYVVIVANSAKIVHHNCIAPS
jgi:hypothetical protein